MYLYSLFAVYYIDTVYTGDVYDENGDIITENMCTNLLQCFLVTMQKGFILGGGIGDYVGKESFE